MTNDNSSDTPSVNPQDQPPVQSPAPSPPQKGQVSNDSDSRSGVEKSKTVQLEEDIRSGERWLIGISAAGVIINVLIALIYLGQLHEMRKATGASSKAADAASSAADTADKTLKEIRAGGADTHELAVQAKNQTDKTGELVEYALAQAEATNKLAAQARQSNNLAQRALDLQLRPWVGIKGENVTQDIVSGEVPVTATVLNSGRTPAIQVVVDIMSAGLCGTGTTFPADAPSRLRAQNPVKGYSTSVLLPDVPLETQRVRVRITDADMPRYKSGECTQFIFGTITYCDVFNHQHFRNFCSFWNSQTTRAFYGCKEYNDGDEDHPNNPPVECHPVTVP